MEWGCFHSILTVESNAKSMDIYQVIIKKEKEKKRDWKNIEIPLFCEVSYISESKVEEFEWPQIHPTRTCKSPKFMTIIRFAKLFNQCSTNVIPKWKNLFIHSYSYIFFGWYFFFKHHSPLSYDGVLERTFGIPINPNIFAWLI